LVFASSFTNNGQAKFAAPLTFNQTTPLSGTGTIDAPSVTAAGLVSPGTSPGSLTLTGDLNLLSTSELLIELSGAGQGTGFDFLSVGGTATLGGELSLHLLSGFGSGTAPIDASATFTVLTATSLTNTFSNVANGERLFVDHGVGSFQVNYGIGSAFGANSLVLSNFSAIPEPSTYALMGLGALLVFWQIRRRK
jgi:hypothetical protein